MSPAGLRTVGRVDLASPNWSNSWGAPANLSLFRIRALVGAECGLERLRVQRGEDPAGRRMREHAMQRLPGPEPLAPGIGRGQQDGGRKRR